jgi:membrane protease YdiL (CAAX protease family)
VEETLRVLVAFGFGLLLVMLRLDAERFGVAEYLASANGGRLAVARRRFAWYAMGIALIAAVLVVYPGPDGQLGLQIGDRSQAILAGLGFGAIGIAQAAGVALIRFGRVRLPDSRSYPIGLVNAILTAFIDEATFRAILLGFLLQAGVEPLLAIVIQALAYTLATRTGAGGRDRYLLLLSLAIGLIGGWLTVETGGIAAAVLGHAITRTAVFVLLGPDQAEPAMENDAPTGPALSPDPAGLPGSRASRSSSASSVDGR